MSSFWTFSFDGALREKYFIMPGETVLGLRHLAHPNILVVPDGLRATIRSGSLVTEGEKLRVTSEGDSNSTYLFLAAHEGNPEAGVHVSALNHAEIRAMGMVRQFTKRAVLEIQSGGSALITFYGLRLGRGEDSVTYVAELSAKSHIPTLSSHLPGVSA